jgi:hypothetical protein
LEELGSLGNSWEGKNHAPFFGDETEAHPTLRRRDWEKGLWDLSRSGMGIVNQERLASAARLSI